MNQNACMINTIGIEPSLLDPDTDLNKVFLEKTGTTPGDANFNWSAYIVTPLGPNINASAQFPFPDQTNASLPFYPSYPLTQEALLGHSQTPTLGMAGFLKQRPAPTGYPANTMVTQDRFQPSCNVPAPVQQQTIVVDSMKTELVALQARTGATQKKVTAAAAATNPEDAPQPIRRGRAKRKIRTDEEILLRRENHLTPNRNAAQKCRARKKILEDKRRGEILALRTKNQELWIWFDRLKLELQTLREAEFPKLEAWETGKLAACTKALDMEELVLAKMQAMREMHDQKKLPRHIRKESPSDMERSVKG